MCERIITATLSTVGHIIEWRPGLAPIAKGILNFLLFLLRWREKSRLESLAILLLIARVAWDIGERMDTRSWRNPQFTRVQVFAQTFFFSFAAVLLLLELLYTAAGGSCVKHTDVQTFIRDSFNSCRGFVTWVPDHMTQVLHMRVSCPIKRDWEDVIDGPLAATARAGLVSSTSRPSTSDIFSRIEYALALIRFNF